jgi:hypothetical protein
MEFMVMNRTDLLIAKADNLRQQHRLTRLRNKIVQEFQNDLNGLQHALEGIDEQLKDSRPTESFFLAAVD